MFCVDLPEKSAILGPEPNSYSEDVSGSSCSNQQVLISIQMRLQVWIRCRKVLFLSGFSSAYSVFCFFYPL